MRPAAGGSPLGPPQRVRKSPFTPHLIPDTYKNIVVMSVSELHGVTPAGSQALPARTPAHAGKREGKREVPGAVHFPALGLCLCST